MGHDILSKLCAQVTCKVHKSKRRDGSYMQELRHPFIEGPHITLQDTIPWEFHPCQETDGNDGQKTGPRSVASSFNMTP